MRKFPLHLMVVTALTLSAPIARAFPVYDNLYVFGDSYCDVGNVFIATHGAKPAAPYYAGRFSNGPIWVDHIAGFLHVPLKPYLAGGTDFAFGGAWVTAPVVTPEGTIPSVPEQVALYLSLHGGKADPNALYILEGGGNDILGTTSGSPEGLAFKIALGISESELLLRRAGAKHFLIPNLFNVGMLPAAAANAAFATKASVATDKYLYEFLKIEELLEEIHILRIDVFSLLYSIKTDPTHFGFTDIKDPCITTVLCADPDHTLYWDIEHPTEFAHGYFAVTAESALALQ